MRNPLSSPSAINLGLLLARVPLGIYFGLAGYLKVKAGVSNFVNQSMGMAQHYMPEGVARGFLTALPFAEILIGALLVFGLFTRIGALLSALLLLSITIATGAKVLDPGPFNDTIVFLGLSLALLTIGPGKLSADGLLFKGAKDKH